MRFILLRSLDDFLRIKDFCKSITSADNILGTLLVLVYQMKKNITKDLCKFLDAYLMNISKKCSWKQELTLVTT